MTLRRLSAALAGLVVLAQITYPLVDGEPLQLVTIATVLLFAAASAVHAASCGGLRWAAGLVVVAGGIGLLTEAVGVRTGYPFGSYRYAGTLGPQALDVPVIVPLAWVMMAYPCLLLGRALARGRRARAATVALTGGFTLAAWDLFLDPQMVAAGHWTWAFPSPSLPGIGGIPLTNFAGWLLVAVVIVAALDRVLDHRPAVDQTVPAALLGWTWLGSSLGNAVFFGRPLVALWGFAAMGLCCAPYLLGLRRRPT